MLSALVVATLLTADPDLHGGAAITLGVAVPFKNVNTGFQFSVKGYGELVVASKISVGAVLPFGFGFYNQSSGFVSVNMTTVDIMPGLRGAVQVHEWIHAAIELGVGPSIFNQRISAGSFGSNDSTRTDPGFRASLLVEVALPQLAGVLIVIEPVTMQARFGNATFSEYRFSVGVGYRR